MWSDYITLAEEDVKIQDVVLKPITSYLGKGKLVLLNCYLNFRLFTYLIGLIAVKKMIKLKSKLILALSVLAFILGAISPSYAATSIHISARASDTQVSTLEEVGVSGDESFFSIDIFKFFDNFFGRKLKAQMQGAQEVPGPGDPDAVGQAKVTIDSDKGELCTDLEIENIDPANAAHIHFAPFGASGAVVAMLPIPDSEGKAKGCESVDSNLLQAIKDNPEDYYVNIHTGS